MSATEEPQQQQHSKRLQYRESCVTNDFTLLDDTESALALAHNERNSITLHELAKGLHEVFSSDNISVEVVQKLLAKYNPETMDDWRQYVKFDDWKYTRNLIDVGNSRFELMLLGWGEDQFSSIHDHAGSHCFMKVLDGGVEESLYHWPDKTEDNNNNSKNNDNFNDNNNKSDCGMKLKKPREVHTEGILYINDSIGLHRIGNPNLTKKAVTMHIYSPPITECHRFDEKTGRKWASGKCTFYSQSGIDINQTNIVKL